MENKIKCPRCNSTNVSTGTKGYGLVKGATGGIILGPLGLLAGLIGSKRIRIDCLLCGHHWDHVNEIERTNNVKEYRLLKKDIKEQFKQNPHGMTFLLINTLIVALVVFLFKSL